MVVNLKIWVDGFFKSLRIRLKFSFNTEPAWGLHCKMTEGKRRVSRDAFGRGAVAHRSHAPGAGPIRVGDRPFGEDYPSVFIDDSIRDRIPEMRFMLVALMHE